MVISGKRHLGQGEREMCAFLCRCRAAKKHASNRPTKQAINQSTTQESKNTRQRQIKQASNQPINHARKQEHKTALNQARKQASKQAGEYATIKHIVSAYPILNARNVYRRPPSGWASRIVLVSFSFLFDGF